MLKKEEKLSPKLKREMAKMSKDRDQLYQSRMSYIQKQLSYCQRTVWGFVKNQVRCREAQKKYQSWMRQALSEKQNITRQLPLKIKNKMYSSMELEARKGER